MKSTRTATDQYQMMRVIWPKWRTIANSTGRTNKTRAEEAVKRLYRHFRYENPSMCWLDSLHRLPGTLVGTPLVSHARETLIYSVWHKLADPAWVCSQIGYSQQEGSFLLPLNMPLLTARSFISPRRIGRRPRWLLNCANMISQFDVDVLAIQQLASTVGIPVEAEIAELAEIMGEIVRSCFAVILFEESCLLIMKPRKVVLSEGHQLSSQGGSAFESHQTATARGSVEVEQDPFEVYATNGRIISVNETPDTSWSTLRSASSPTRVALIEYMSWEVFLKMTIQQGWAKLTDKSRFGELWFITCGTQEFLVVKVKNSTPEPNGKYKRYVIPVDRDCRPLPDPRNPRSRMGAPQVLTAVNGIGSTFGMTGERYVRILGAES